MRKGCENMIGITGDTHGDFGRFQYSMFPEQADITRDVAFSPVPLSSKMLRYRYCSLVENMIYYGQTDLLTTME